MGNEEFVKKVYLGSVEDADRRGRLIGIWEYKVKVYVCERGVKGNGLGWARRECMDRERWRSVCRGHPFCGHLRCYHTGNSTDFIAIDIATDLSFMDFRFQYNDFR